MAEPKPPLHTDLIWDGDLRFSTTVGTTSLVTDGDGVAGPSPMHLMALGVLSCMAADVVAILRKGRQPVEALHATFTGIRLDEPPRRFTSITLHFTLTGALPDDVVSRAIELSRTRYCSAWNSMRDDITLTTTYAIVSG
jgi:putative redox protein